VTTVLFACIHNAGRSQMGIELGSSRPRRLTDALASTTTWLVAMGCGETCPLVPGLRRLD